jgi:hypothetical protein
MYEFNEIEYQVHQNDHCFDNEHKVLEGVGDRVMHLASRDGKVSVIEANLADLLRGTRKAVNIKDGNR